LPGIGVFVCWCGSNIASTVDVERVVEEVSKLRDVSFVTHYKYMCSSPGQNIIKEAIQNSKLEGVVVAACSPRMHELTFRKAAKEAGLNPYLLEMANIREQCSWVHSDKKIATEKAIQLIRMSVAKVTKNLPLEEIKVSVIHRALVIGGGIAGIQSALDLAEAGIETLLLERTPSIGGHMAQLDETFPTLDCSQCILTPKMVSVAQNPHITLHTYSELEKVDGFVGNFRVTIKHKARFVDEKKCTGCGLCQQKCPTQIPAEFDEGIGKRKAIYIPFPQAVPNIPVIDKEHCIWFKKGKCRVCEKVCPAGAINYEQQDEYITEEVGAIIVATGYRLMPKNVYGEYGYGRFKDVINGLEFERMLSASGPTSGKVLRPSDGKEPKVVVFIQCAGSRDPRKGVPYCSRICCMYTAKHSMLLKHKCPGVKAIVFYIDIRAGGKGYEEFVRRAEEEEGATFIRGRVSRIYQKGNKLIVKGVDTLTGSQLEVEADLVVLATAIMPQEDAKELAQKLGISYDEYGFFTEAHPKLRPVETSKAGVFLAGCAQAPKDIPDVVAQASGAASKVLALFSNKELVREPIIAKVDEVNCVGCFACEKSCPAQAITRKEIRDKSGNLIKEVAKVEPGVCQGCGACVVTCRGGCIRLEGFSDEQLFAEVNVL